MVRRSTTISDHSQTYGPEPGLFGVPARKLHQVATRAVGEDVVDVRVDIPEIGRRTYPGQRSQSLIAVLNCRTVPGDSRSVPVFVKRLDRPGPVEAHHYRHLERAQMPVPRMYGCWRDKQRREVLFLEFLDAFDGDDYDFTNDAHRWYQLLSIFARINALRPSAAYRKRLWALDFSHWARDWPTNWDALCADALEGKLGRPLHKICAEAQPLNATLRRLHRRVEKAVPEMKPGFILQDCTPHQTGRRTGSAEWLVFDLELACIGPRFYDVAPWLGSRSHPAPERRPRAVAGRYLEEYQRHGGSIPSIEQFLPDAALLRMTRLRVYVAWWHGRALGQNVAADRESTRRIRRLSRRKLLHEVQFLLSETRTPGSVYG